MKVSYIPYDGREKNDLAFSDKNKHRWTYVLKNMLEEEGSEIHTYDILPLEEADAILSFDNMEVLSEDFLQSCVGQLYENYSHTEIKKNMRIENISFSGKVALKRVVDKAKEKY